MLCWDLVEQTGHGHMSDEYKNRYVNYSTLVTPILGYQIYEITTVSSLTELI